MSRECKDWLRNYISYTTNQQSPTVFHLWTGISTIASALRRKCWMDRGYYTLYPNMYICLVSPSGVGNKTTATNIATDNILEKAVEGVNIMRGVLTIPYLIDWMSEAAKKSPTGDSDVTISCEEFRVFTKGTGRDMGLIENLTKLYDCGVYDYGTKGKGTYSIKKPCINLLAGSTPEWLSAGSAADFVGGGFSSRLIPIGLNKDERSIAWPEKGEVEKSLEGKLIHDLGEIGKFEGKYTVTGPARDYFEEWYHIRNDYKIADDRLNGYYSKKHDMALKLSMILSASDGDDMVVEDKHIEMALKTLHKVEESMQFAYSGVAWGELAGHTDRVLRQIEDEGEIQLSQLTRINQHYLTGKELDEVLNVLEQSELITITWPLTELGRPKKVIKFVKHGAIREWKGEEK